MRLLLDTHAFLWWADDSKRLSRRVRSLIVDPSNDVYFSTASASEVALKARLGRLDLPADLSAWFADQLEEDQITVLPVSLAHAAKVRSLSLGHRDPFDLLLISQALVEQLPVATYRRSGLPNARRRRRLVSLVGPLQVFAQAAL